MSKKQLDTGGITNELQGASLFFQRPSVPHPIAPQPTEPPASTPESVRLAQFPTVYEAAERSGEVKTEHLNERSVVRKPTRKVIRHTFDIYADQLSKLQRLQLEAIRNGRKKPTMGGLVQKALDLYLQKK
jgi:hypothetical protein